MSCDDLRKAGAGWGKHERKRVAKLARSGRLIRDPDDAEKVKVMLRCFLSIRFGKTRRSEVWNLLMLFFLLAASSWWAIKDADWGAPIVKWVAAVDLSLAGMVLFLVWLIARYKATARENGLELVSPRR